MRLLHWLLAKVLRLDHPPRYRQVPRPTPPTWPEPQWHVWDEDLDGDLSEVERRMEARRPWMN